MTEEQQDQFEGDMIKGLYEKFRTRGGSLVRALEFSKRKVIGEYFDRVTEDWFPISWDVIKWNCGDDAIPKLEHIVEARVSPNGVTELDLVMIDSEQTEENEAVKSYKQHVRSKFESIAASYDKSSEMVKDSVYKAIFNEKAKLVRLLSKELV